MNCNICPRNCNVNRKENAGFCSQKTLKINKAVLHFWEEPIISGNNGSGTIFFSGCNLKCIYCQNYYISSENKGIEVSINDIVKIMQKLEEKGAHNINFVTPTHFTNEIIEALKIYKPQIPIVWNTSGYEKTETIEKLKDFVDIFLFDLKYYDKNLSKEYSGAENYFEFASKSLLKIREILKEDIINNGIMQKGIIVRHLLLPSSSSDSIKIIDFINKNLGNDTIISLLNQYTPYYKAKNHPVLQNKVKAIEYKRVVNYLIKLNFKNAFVQENSSASEEYIPNFKNEFNLQEFLKS